ncbi:nucleotidyltransferase family protein [Denitrobacterium detoxificans]|jgi:hypothetical protein|uniref:nucleotidyltransferase family protein n=1 Tax=Denitrobacterium detoxificans TaxID=79604 RepID=UPI0026EED379|nr:nucleotidyltransferase family protein [Denitrobacterium detoxificans]
MLPTKELVERIRVFEGCTSQNDSFGMMRVVNRLSAFGVLLPCKEELSLMSGVLQDSFRRMIYSFERRDRLLIQALILFIEEARRQHLRFVVMKGAPQAKRLYGSELMRSYSDVDILVAQEDLPKADYVARTCGFMQPAEFFAIRNHLDDLSQSEVESIQAPYMLRHRFDVAHLSPYVALVNGTWVGLEIHDRLFGVGPLESTPFVWDTCICSISGFDVNVPSDARMLAMLLLFAYEDSETYFSNATPNSLGLKIYLDLARAIEVCGVSLLNEATCFLSEWGLDDCGNAVLSNLADLLPSFSGIYGLPDSNKHFPCYTDRLFDTELRKESAECTFLGKLRGSEDELVLKDGRYVHFEWRKSIAPGIACLVCVSEGFLRLKWEIPSCLVVDIAGFVFQVRLYPLFQCDISEVMIDLFVRNGEPVCRARISHHISRRKKASYDVSGFCCRCSINAGGCSEGISVDVTSLLSTLFSVQVERKDHFVSDASVFQHECGRLFHEKWSDGLRISGAGRRSVVDPDVSK